MILLTAQHHVAKGQVGCGHSSGKIGTSKCQGRSYLALVPIGRNSIRSIGASSILQFMQMEFLMNSEERNNAVRFDQTSWRERYRDEYEIPSRELGLGIATDPVKNAEMNRLESVRKSLIAELPKTAKKQKKPQTQEDFQTLWLNIHSMNQFRGTKNHDYERLRVWIENQFKEPFPEFQKYEWKVRLANQFKAQAPPNKKTNLSQVSKKKGRQGFSDEQLANFRNIRKQYESAKASGGFNKNDFLSQYELTPKDLTQSLDATKDSAERRRKHRRDNRG